jgi:hypothetical protein
MVQPGAAPPCPSDTAAAGQCCRESAARGHAWRRAARVPVQARPAGGRARARHQRGGASTRVTSKKVALGLVARARRRARAVAPFCLAFLSSVRAHRVLSSAPARRSSAFALVRSSHALGAHSRSHAPIATRPRAQPRATPFCAAHVATVWVHTATQPFLIWRRRRAAVRKCPLICREPRKSKRASRDHAARYIHDSTNQTDDARCARVCAFEVHICLT